MKQNNVRITQVSIHFEKDKINNLIIVDHSNIQTLAFDLITYIIIQYNMVRQFSSRKNKDTYYIIYLNNSINKI